MSIINRDTLKSRLDKGESIRLVDALPSDVYQEGHLPGALSLPVDSIEKRAGGLLRDKNEQIVTYCGGKSCDASKRAADKLRAMGYTNVSEYTDGKEDWVKAGLPLETADPSEGDDIISGVQQPVTNNGSRSNVTNNITAP